MQLRVRRVNQKHTEVKEKVNDLQGDMSRSMMEAEVFEKNYFSSEHPKTRQV